MELLGGELYAFPLLPVVQPCELERLLLPKMAVLLALAVHQQQILAHEPNNGNQQTLAG